VDAGAGQAIGGYQRGATQARSGVEQSYQAELGANKQIYVTRVDARRTVLQCQLRSGQLKTSCGCYRGGRA